MQLKEIPGQAGMRCQATTNSGNTDLQGSLYAPSFLPSHFPRLYLPLSSLM